MKDFAQFKLNLPNELRDFLKAEAAKNVRSINAEIVSRLQDGTETLRDWFAGQALGPVGGSVNAPPGARLEEVCAEIAKAAYMVADAMLSARSKDRSEP